MVLFEFLCQCWHYICVQVSLGSDWTLKGLYDKVTLVDQRNIIMYFEPYHKTIADTS
jgi:hypothetical protein